MKGILADINAIGQVTYLVQQMQAKSWADFWHILGLQHMRFADVGLTPTSTDLEIWQTCQKEQLILITDNRSQDSPNSLEATIRQFNTSDSLPVFTIGDLDRFSSSRNYFEEVLESFYDYLLRIDSVRGTGRIFLP